MKQTFGFDFEIALFWSPFDSTQPRIIQAINQILFDDPFRGRADNSLFLIVSRDKNISDWVSYYSSISPIPRTAVGIYEGDLLKSGPNDGWLIRNMIAEQLFQQDLFDNRLPLNNDLFFFGRKDITHSLVELIKRGENSGIFGLRKTGKTSILFRVQRHLTENSIAHVIYYDCKVHDVRSLSWKDLVLAIAKRVGDHFNIRMSLDRERPSRHLREVCAAIPHGQRVCIIFDEIEYISFLAKLDPHWREEYVTFWQTLWSIQSVNRKLSTIVCGVNAGLMEVDLVDGVQNPLFQLFTPTYLTGLERADASAMIRTFGRRMGLDFDAGAIDYLHNQYGGHPLLTRMACSYCHHRSEFPRNKRPLKVTESYLRDSARQRDAELEMYSSHAVSEIQLFYPFEFDLLKMIARGQVADVIELEAPASEMRHIEKYGLIRVQEGVRPVFAIPVIERYIAKEAAKSSGDRWSRALVPADDRKEWLARRTKTIFRDIRRFSEAAESKKRFSPWSAGRIEEPEELATCSVSENAETFRAFIMTAYRSLVENRDPKAIENIYPDLGFALRRIRLYRHNEGHLKLTGNYDPEFRRILEMDTAGQSSVRDGDFYFLLQQCSLDELFAALQIEIARLE